MRNALLIEHQKSSGRSLMSPPASLRQPWLQLPNRYSGPHCSLLRGASYRTASSGSRCTEWPAPPVSRRADAVRVCARQGYTRYSDSYVLVDPNPGFVPEVQREQQRLGCVQLSTGADALHRMLSPVRYGRPRLKQAASGAGLAGAGPGRRRSDVCHKAGVHEQRDDRAGHLPVANAGEKCLQPASGQPPVCACGRWFRARHPCLPAPSHLKTCGGLLFMLLTWCWGCSPEALRPRWMARHTRWRWRARGRRSQCIRPCSFSGRAIQPGAQCESLAPLNCMRWVLPARDS